MINQHPDALLDDYAVDALSQVERERVEEHLTSCARCRRYVQSLRTTATLYRRLPVVALPRSFILAGDVLPRRLRTWQRTPWSMLSAAAVLFLAFAISFAVPLPNTNFSGAGAAPRQEEVSRVPVVNAPSPLHTAPATGASSSATPQSPRSLHAAVAAAQSETAPGHRLVLLRALLGALAIAVLVVGLGALLRGRIT